MKQILYLLLFTILINCSSNDDSQDENQLCDCGRITLVYQGDNEDTEIIGEIIETVFQIDCDTEDESYLTDNNRLVTVDYTCD